MYVRVQKYLLLQKKKKKKFSETSRWFPCFPNFKWLNCCGLSVYTVLFIFTHCNSSEQLTVKHKVCKIIFNIYFISYLFIYFFACAYFLCGLLTCTNKKNCIQKSKLSTQSSGGWRTKHRNSAVLFYITVFLWSRSRWATLMHNTTQHYVIL